MIIFDINHRRVRGQSISNIGLVCRMMEISNYYLVLVFVVRPKGVKLHRYRLSYQLFYCRLGGFWAGLLRIVREVL